MYSVPIDHGRMPARGFGECKFYPNTSVSVLSMAAFDLAWCLGALADCVQVQVSVTH